MTPAGPRRPLRRSRRTAAAVAVGALLMCGLSACGGDDVKAGDLHGKVLDPPFTVSGQPLVDTDGDPYSLTGSTDKRLTLVFFGYTNCPDICGTVMGNLASAMTRLDAKDRDQVDVVFVTTDPERDTGPVLRHYLDRFDPSFIGLTDDPSEIDQIAAVASSVAVGMGEELPTGGYDVDAHTTQVTGIDSADEAPIYWGQTTSSAQFAQDIHTLLGDA
jgi:protein SCO1/2